MVATTVVAVAQPTVKIEETGSEKHFDTSKFISLDTDEAVKEDVIAPKPPHHLDEGPITPPTTPELKLKAEITSSRYIYIYLMCIFLLTHNNNSIKIN